jgi:hypothetical protein
MPPARKFGREPGSWMTRPQKYIEDAHQRPIVALLRSYPIDRFELLRVSTTFRSKVVDDI